METAPFPLAFDVVLALTTAPYLLSNPAPAAVGAVPVHQAKLALIQACLSAGAVPFSKRCSSLGDGPVVLWEQTLVSKGGLPRAVLAQMARVDPRLGPVNDEGEAPFAAVLRFWLTSKDPTHLGERLSAWASVVDSAQLCRWDLPTDVPAAGLLRKLVTASAHCAKTVSPAQWSTVLSALESRGLDWRLAGAALTEPGNMALVEALLHRGLDISQAVPTPEGMQPLWRVWLGLQSSKLIAWVQDRLPQPSPVEQDSDAWPASTSLQPLQVAQYFQAFGAHREPDKKVPIGKRRAALVAHLTSRPDWLSLQNAEGRTALFLACRLDVGVLRWVFDRLEQPTTTEQEREALIAGLRHRDKQGRNLWFYVLPQLNSQTVATPKLCEQLGRWVPSALDAQGNGWIHQALASPGSARKAWNVTAEKGPTRSWETGDWWVLSADQTHLRQHLGTGWETASGLREEVFRRSVAGTLNDGRAAPWSLLKSSPEKHLPCVAGALAWASFYERPLSPANDFERLLQEAQGEPELWMDEDAFARRIRSAREKVFKDGTLGLCDTTNPLLEQRIAVLVAMRQRTQLTARWEKAPLRSRSPRL